MNFDTFRLAVATQFARMQSYPIYRVSIDKDLLWSTYLDSFPPGTIKEIEQKRITAGVCRHCGEPVPCWSSFRG